MKRCAAAVALCLIAIPSLAETFAKIDDYIVDRYRERGETSATAECLARSMVLAIPAPDRAELLKAVNGQDDASDLMDKWLPIGNEKIRPEINDTMYGFCPIEWTDYVGKGTLR